MFTWTINDIEPNYANIFPIITDKVYKPKLYICDYFCTYNHSILKGGCMNDTINHIFIWQHITKQRL